METCWLISKRVNGQFDFGKKARRVWRGCFICVVVRLAWNLLGFSSLFFFLRIKGSKDWREEPDLSELSKRRIRKIICWALSGTRSQKRPIRITDLTRNGLRLENNIYRCIHLTEEKDVNGRKVRERERIVKYHIPRHWKCFFSKRNNSNVALHLVFQR